MHVLNVYDKDYHPCCLFTRGSKELEMAVNLIYRDGYFIQDILPLNHLCTGGTKYLRLIISDNETSEIKEFSFVNFYDLDSYINRKDISILRVFPMS